MPFALILFIAMPIVEIAVLLRVGDALGWFPTLGIVVLTAVLGAAMLRQQGLATLNKARQRMGSGEMPAQQLLEALFLMIGGVLLLTPGFVTDAFGFACLLPWSRQWLAKRIAAKSVIGMAGMGGSGHRGAGHPGSGHAGSSQPGFGHPGVTQPGPRGSTGTTVGSGATQGAENSGSSASAYIPESGGRPQVNKAPKRPDGDVIDAEFRHIDD